MPTHFCTCIIQITTPQVHSASFAVDNWEHRIGPQLPPELGLKLRILPLNHSTRVCI